MTKLFEAKPFIIAEVGSNWQTLEHCLESIRVAAEVGADAVKFQAFNFKSMYGYDGPPMPHELSLRWLPELKDACDHAGIEFMCTAFSPELIRAVDPFVEIHKIASSDSKTPQMLRAAADTGKPVLVSFGATYGNESTKALEYLNHAITIPMECVAAYPADYVDIASVGNLFRGKGYSDHTLGYSVAVELARRGVIVIEKHFTACHGLDTPDCPHSLNPSQFAHMVAGIRGRIDNWDAEEPMRLRHNRRLIATTDIAAGARLEYGVNFGAYRSLKDDTKGLSPFDWELVQGKLSTQAIKRGDSIGGGDFQ